MVTVHKEVDPDGDLLVILSEPSGPFAPFHLKDQQPVGHRGETNGSATADSNYEGKQASAEEDSEYQPHRSLKRKLN